MTNNIMKDYYTIAEVFTKRRAKQMGQTAELSDGAVKRNIRKRQQNQIMEQGIF